MRDVPGGPAWEQLAAATAYLRPGGRLLLVEYDTDHGNRWVPYPLSYDTWEFLAARAGFTATRLLAVHPSRYFHRIYSAASERGEDSARPS